MRAFAIGWFVRLITIEKDERHVVEFFQRKTFDILLKLRNIHADASHAACVHLSRWRREEKQLQAEPEQYSGSNCDSVMCAHDGSLLQVPEIGDARC
jgi:hypothetical protein